MKTAYFDCTSGISGDMCLGALASCLGPEEGPRTLRRALARLPLKGYRLEAKEVTRAGFGALKVDVRLTRAALSNTRARRFDDVRKLLTSSTLSAGLKASALAAFRRLYEAEARVHGLGQRAWERAHLHELGAVDAIVDIVGSLAMVEALGIKSVQSSALELGSGSVATEHGVLTVPAPATSELLKGVPVTSGGLPFEATTPTGALIITSLATGYGPMQAMELQCIGTGAGGKDYADKANILRVFCGETAIKPDSHSKNEQAIVLECNLDDMSPQIYEHVIERLFGAGALDVLLTPVIMKKSRPGVVLTVLTAPAHLDSLKGIIFEETTTLGLRMHTVGRTMLDRRFESVSTKYGKIKIKIATLPGGLSEKQAPEYEDLRAAALRHKVPLREVQAEAMRAYKHGKGLKRPTK